MVSDSACHVNMQNLVTLNKSNAIVISDICLTQFTFLSNKELNGNNLCHVLHMSSTFRCRDMSNKSFVYFKMIKLGHICIWIIRYQIYIQTNLGLESRWIMWYIFVFTSYVLVLLWLIHFLTHYFTISQFSCHGKLGDCGTSWWFDGLKTVVLSKYT